MEGLTGEKVTVESLLTEANDNFNRAKMEFIEEWNHYQHNSVYGFVEGYDCPYYLPKISYATDTSTTIINCGGKQNVIKMYHFLRLTPEYQGYKYLYFVDKDYDDNSQLSPNIFVTDGYSVENYYCTHHTVIEFLRNVAHFNNTQIRAVQEVVIADFNEWANKFFEASKPFCAWYKCTKKDGCDKKKKVNKVIPDKYLIINKHDITCIEYNFNQLNEDYKVIPPVTEESYTSTLSSITTLNDIRGKFLMPLIEHFLRHVLEKFKNNKYPILIKDIQFPNKSENLLADLANYAYTPNRLKEYIKSRI